ncbi:PREDICTED: defensin-like protein 195 [Tarenaya hassleriana]|uniref:defensin-like protein 195 n=1 Tax=Tarenaya hassleriana TaxID=28532 RepID=UPI00053C47CF|nr:PREDICTED: defensin-like protein 195 [Tarenaya hassleriana]
MVTLQVQSRERERERGREEMANAIKSASIFLVFFVLFLVVIEVPKTEAGDECLKPYGGNVGFRFCAPRIFPTFCYQRCRSDKGAKGGRCDWRGGGKVICYCDYCSDEPRIAIKMKTTNDA